MATKMNILVASASANTGSKLVELLSAAGSVSVKAMVRKPESDASKTLAALPNVSLVVGDFNDAASIKAVLVGVQRAFLVCSPGDDSQYECETNFIAAASEAGVEVVVRISTANLLISLESKGVYAKAHARIEQYIAEHKSKVVDLQPNWFMTNFLWSAGEAKASGTISYPVSASEMNKTAMIDPRDIAGAAAAILMQPIEKVNEFIALGRVQLHGPELKDFSEKAAALSKYAGKEIVVNTITPAQYTAGLVGAGMSERFASSFCETIQMMGGGLEPPRPACNETSPLMLKIWQPKYTLDMWAKDHAAMFA